jgi:multidrug efflux pump
MPQEMGFDYMGMSFQEQQAQKGVPPAMIFGLSLLFVFLILAALYESWSLPFSVLLGTPVAVFGAYLALSLRGMENNIYAQIGLVMLIGLAAKNAILIVEFAKDKQQEGLDRLSAVLEACRLRLRPILMTSIAFIMGVVPLVLSSGAGAEMRHAMGVAVFSGMLGVTFFGLLLTPVFYVLIRRFIEAREAKKQQRASLTHEAHHA